MSIRNGEKAKSNDYSRPKHTEPLRPSNLSKKFVFGVLKRGGGFCQT